MRLDDQFQQTEETGKHGGVCLDTMTNSDPALQGEQYLGLQRAPVYDVIAIDSTDVTQINEAIVGSISAEPSQGTFRIQGKQVGSSSND